MIDLEHARAFADDWIAAWNTRDLQRILAHYSAEFEFISPNIVAVMGEPSGRLVGKVAVAEYWSKALAGAPDLHFDLVHVLRGVNSVILYYRNQAGRTGAEMMEFGAEGKVSRSIAHYVWPKEDGT